jgi:hypothetical protein
MNDATKMSLLRLFAWMNRSGAKIVFNAIASGLYWRNLMYFRDRVFSGSPLLDDSVECP